MENQYKVGDLPSLATNTLCLFDQLKVGFSARLVGLTAAELQAFRHELHRTGVLNVKRSRRNPRCIVLDVPIATDDGELIADASVELFLERLDVEAVQITARSCIAMNLVQPLRALMDVSPTGASLDGKLNYIGPTAQQSGDVLELQYSIADHAVTKVCEVIEAALAPSVEVHEPLCWLRVVEIHHDLETENAIQVARAVCHSALEGMRLGHHDSYRSGKSRDRVPVAHWRATKSGEIVKVYAKTPWLARIEVGCGNRDSIAACCGERKTAALSGEGVTELMYAFYEKAAPTAATAIGHVQRAATSSRSPMEYMSAIHPLFQLARRERSGDGYRPSAAVAAAAENAANDLVSDGVCHVRGQRKGSKLREVLDKVTEGNGPLRTGAQGTIYCLRPEFGRAAAELSKKSLGNIDPEGKSDRFEKEEEGKES